MPPTLPAPFLTLTRRHSPCLTPRPLLLYSLYAASSLMDSHDIYARAVPRLGSKGAFLYR
jgi:hypothetical protein